jgi:hypothetical protein
MNKHDKLLKRFYNLPRDFTFDETVNLFAQFGFHLETKGSSSGSRVEFINEKTGDTFAMHKPHPANIIKGYMMRQMMKYFQAKKYID